MNSANEVGSLQVYGAPLFLTVIFPRYCAAPLISKDLLILGGSVMEGGGGTGTVLHCAVLSSFVATMGKVSRAAAGGVSFRRLLQHRNPLKNKCFLVSHPSINAVQAQFGLVYDNTS